ncbi:MAG: nickel pincer cofactor biosynthesis protein LarB [Patescibacteria group bacterium]
MDRDRLLALLTRVAAGEVEPGQALDQLAMAPYEDLGFAKVDHHRTLRQGEAEVVYCPGKTPGQVASIMASLAKGDGNILATRASEEVYRAVRETLPQAEYSTQAGMVYLRRRPEWTKGEVCVVSAGTADARVAEEAALTATLMGSTTHRVYDVGVAGLHRLLNQRDLLLRARVVVVVAGMEGALASVVGGLVHRPVVAVPTSVGYGASFAGLAALLSMLNSCASGVGVVNIDNGFGAGVLAHRINRMGEQSCG